MWLWLMVVFIAGIQAGLGKPLTAVPLFLLTAKELTIKGKSLPSLVMPAAGS